ncbi:MULTISPECIES: hypothetical protein [unclassified Photobacterium]|uniref:hypothetical protein n=1 Tax=unclassified Photobacterium TaxID=2628852 RepID=UPI001EE0DB39|nr:MULTISPECIES: hypothetical protein [unclassified Photobacterium]MCG3865644.1 hypothetical protein [Photobacterium sp. Ph6]MCG3877145.1 hypothetical protein [Photobacterium sp. Ph5]
MQPTFDTAFYQRSHMDLDDELMTLALSLHHYSDQSQTLLAIWSDDAGQRARQIHIQPLLEQYELFEGTARQYYQYSEERLRCFFEMTKLINEYAGLHSSLEEREEDTLRQKDEYQRATTLSERHRDKGLEFTSKSERFNHKASKYVTPI